MGKEVILMALAEKDKNKLAEQEKALFIELDKGIDDMEQGRTYSHSDAMKMILERLKIHAV